MNKYAKRVLDMAKEVVCRTDTEEVLEEKLRSLVDTVRFSTALALSYPESLTFHSDDCFDSYLGVCDCPVCKGAGINKLGSILEMLRSELLYTIDYSSIPKYESPIRIDLK